jgi:hypothetical protein
MLKRNFLKSQRFNFGGKQISIKAGQEKSRPAPADTFLASDPRNKAQEAGSKLTIDKDCPPIASANADERQWIADRLRIGSASYVSKGPEGVRAKY